MEDQFREERENDERAKAAQGMVSEMKNEEKEDDDDLDVSLSAAPDLDKMTRQSKKIVRVATKDEPREDIKSYRSLR